MTGKHAMLGPKELSPFAGHKTAPGSEEPRCCADAEALCSAKPIASTNLAA